MTKLKPKQADILQSMVNGCRLRYTERTRGPGSHLLWPPKGEYGTSMIHVHASTVESLVKLELIKRLPYRIGSFGRDFELLPAGESALEKYIAQNGYPPAEFDRRLFEIIDAFLDRDAGFNHLMDVMGQVCTDDQWQTVKDTLELLHDPEYIQTNESVENDTQAKTVEPVQSEVQQLRDALKPFVTFWKAVRDNSNLANRDDFVFYAYNDAELTVDMFKQAEKVLETE